MYIVYTYNMYSVLYIHFDSYCACKIYISAQVYRWSKLNIVFVVVIQLDYNAHNHFQNVPHLYSYTHKYISTVHVHLPQVY